MKSAVITRFLLTYAYAIAPAMVFANQSPISKTNSNREDRTENAKPIALQATDPIYRIPAKLQSCDIPQEVILSGKTETAKQAVIINQWPSHIEKIHVNVGDSVKSGQLIATVSTDFLKSMMGMNTRHLGIETARANQARKELSSAREKQNRVKQLALKGIIPTSKLEEAEKTTFDAENSLSQQERSIISIKKSILKIENQIKESQFFSPIDGVVTRLIADPRAVAGRVVADMNAVVARIDRPDYYIVKSQLLDTQAQSVKAGMPAVVRLASGVEFKGLVKFVSPSALTQSAGKANQYSMPSNNVGKITSFETEIAFEKSGEILPIGAAAYVKVTFGLVRAKQCLSWNSIRVENGRTFLSVFGEKSGWQDQEVALGRRGQHYVEVLSNIEPNLMIASSLW